MPFPFRRESPFTPPRVLEFALLLLVWTALYASSLAALPLLDDADATHAQAAQAMLRTGDWVTLHVDGIRYLEKPPLPYWIAVASLRLLGNNSLAVHLPVALAVLALALLAWHWAHQAFGEELHAPEAGHQHAPASWSQPHARLYAGLFTLTAVGTFLFTRIFIPDALLSVLLAFTLYSWLRALAPPASSELPGERWWAYSGWLALAAAVLTKGLVAPALVAGTFALYLPVSGDLRQWRRLHPASGTLLFLAVAAPWHVLAGLRNRGGANGHGFFWFYFVNEHVLRFLGRRLPPDYNKLPVSLYWTLHTVWLFPWSFFFPVLAITLWKMRKQGAFSRRNTPRTFRERSVLLLLVFPAVVLVFFSLSTNQEYYTFPVYLPLLVLTAGSLANAERPHVPALTPSWQRCLLLCHGALAGVGLLASLALVLALWSSRQLPAAPDVGTLLAHRGVGDYTLSLSHLFDLTGASFAALRTPALLAFAALALGPALSLYLRLHRRHFAATLTLVGMSVVFLFAAHLALLRFAPLLSSQQFAAAIEQMQQSGAIAPNTTVLLYGDQALGSSLPFYLGQQVKLVDGRSTSMLFGSTFPDAPPLFLTHDQLQATWGQGPRKLLFVPEEHRADADRRLGAREIVLFESAGKALVTDRPLFTAHTSNPASGTVK